MTHYARPLRWQVFYAPKKGNTDDEYEDAWAADPARGRFAIADGASETSYAGRWAQLLTQDFLAAPRPRDLHEWMGSTRRRWAAEVMGLDLPWYAEMKREEGAFATLLGLSVRPPLLNRPGKWRAAAVGDSCLIRVRKGCSIRSFPLRHSSDFGNQPGLIGSRRGFASPRRSCGSFRSGDRLLLMTDALAQWFLHRHEMGEHPWDSMAPVLFAGMPDDAFATWIEERRTDGSLRNDDVTLLSIEAGGPLEE